jgi:SPP1 family predicted phage head-tail adaptor
MIPAGKLNRRVELQSKAVTRDAMGGETIAWATRMIISANVSALSGRALIAAQQSQSEVTAEITIRTLAAPGLADDWRVKEGADIYTLHAIIPSNDRVDAKLLVSKGLGNG